MDVPRLETERLRLRAHVHGDFEAHAAMFAEAAVVRHFGGMPLAREESWRKMLASRATWDLLGYGYWALERKVDGAYIGLAGFADFKRDMKPSIEGLPEMGWIVTGAVHGQGYAGEAVRAALAWADTALAGQVVAAIIDPDNAPSIRLAERAGFSEREDARYRDKPILLFRRPAR